MVEKRARIRRVEEVALDVLRVDCEMVDPDKFQFRAGQFISIALDDDRGERRSYSIASSPRRGDGFELLLKRLNTGVGGEFVSSLAAGRELRFTGPMGFFTCDDRHTGDVVMAATGVGISPLLSMMDEILARPPELESGRVVLYWGLRSREDLFWAERLEELARRSPRFRYHVALSVPPPDWTGATGYITPLILATPASLDAPIYYLCGNGAMISDVKRGLERAGVDRARQIRTEEFYPAAKKS